MLSCMCSRFYLIVPPFKKSHKKRQKITFINLDLFYLIVLFLIFIGILFYDIKAIENIQTEQKLP